jgi:hypothetical protein
VRSRDLAIITLCALLGYTDLHAGYTIELNSVPNYRQEFSKVAMAPCDCPEDVDCLWLERRLGEQIGLYKGITVVPAQRVREVMFQLGLQQLDEKSRTQVSEKLDVDSFAVAIVQHSGSQASGMVGFWAGSTIGMSQTAIVKGKVEFLIVRATSGEVLVRGIGYGESEWRTDKGVLWNIFRRIIHKALKS